MKRLDVKRHIGQPVLAAYLKVDGDKHVTVKGEGLLHSADPHTEMAEVWMRGGERVVVHFWHLRKLKQSKVTRSEKIGTRLKDLYTESDVKNAFKLLIQAVEMAEYYGDSRSWLVNNNGNLLGTVRDEKWKRARAFLKEVDESFI